MYYIMFLLFVSCSITFVKAAAPQSLHEKIFHDWDENKDGKATLPEVMEFATRIQKEMAHYQPYRVPNIII